MTTVNSLPMRCIECPHFQIEYDPWKGIDFGKATCKKHDLVIDYISKRQLRRLECVEMKGIKDEIRNQS